VDRKNQVALQPLVAGGLVVASMTHDWLVENGTWLVAFDLATGQRRWSVQLPPSLSGAGWWSRPVAFDGQRIYASRGGSAQVDEYLYALDPADGSILWRSEDLVDLGLGGTPTFLPGGDLVVCGEFLGSFIGFNHLRIDASSGATVWEFGRFISPESGSGSALGNRLYIPQQVGIGTRLARIHPTTGQAMYFSSVAGDGSWDAGVPLAISRTGPIYLQVQTYDSATGGLLGELVAFRDTGSSFQRLWSAPVGPSAWSTLAVESDGSVLVLSRDSRLQRLSPVNGSVLAQSVPLTVPSPTVTCRVAIDGVGKVYATTTPTWDGRLFAFDPNLNLLWRKSLITSPIGGPTLAANGTLLLATFDGGLEAH
jgi:outer membrane protein assembly factor BamB